MVPVGQRFHQERLKKKITLEEVSKATKIRISFLSAIEKGDYKNLPSTAYAQGFVTNYAEFLGLPKKEILALFRREFDEEKIFKVLPEGISRSKNNSFGRPYFRERLIAIIVISLILVGYIAFQYRFAIINPPLNISSPNENQVINSTEIIVSGKTDPNAIVYINDLSTSVLEDGSFKKKINTFSGINTIKIRVLNKFGKETEIKRTIRVKGS